MQSQKRPHGKVILVGVVVAALVVGVWFAAAARADPGPIEIPLGVDYLATSGTLHLDLPIGFFGSGSGAFEDDVGVVGDPFETRGPYEAGTTSLILYRRTDIALAPAPSTQNIVAQTYKLSMVASQAITVQMPGGPEAWDVSVEALPLPLNYGTFDMARTSDTQGTFSAELPVELKIVFTHGTETRILLPGVTTLATSSGTWTTLDTSVSADLAVSQLPLGVALSASFVSPVLDLSISPAVPDPLRPGPAYVDATATIDPAVGSLGRFCTIEANAVIGPGVVIGPNATIEAGATVGSGAIVGDGATVETGASIGNNSVLGPAAEVGALTEVAAGVTIGGSTSVGEECTIEANARIGTGCSIGDDTVVESDVWMGRNATVGSDCTIEGGLIIASGASIATNTTQANPLRLCRLVNGGVEIREVPPGSWPTIATVIGHNLDKSEDISLQAEQVQEEEDVSEGESPDSENPPEGYDDLGDDVGDETAPDDNGGDGPNYDPHHDGTGPKCGWYAEDLRQRLAAMEEGGEAKYDTTFTAIIALNPDWEPDKPGVEKWDEETGHCLTDIHWPDGTITWLEAQYPGDAAVDDEEALDEMDGDENGKINYSDNPEKTGDEPTDGDVLVEVYESREAAEAAGIDIEGQDND